LNDPEQTKKNWSESVVVQALKVAAKRAVQLTPLETLELAIAVIGADEIIHAWGSVSLRLRNLDQLRAACETYQEWCKTQRSAATVTGFLRWLNDADVKQAELDGADAIKVMTYHKAKGLEWPIVIMSSLNAEVKGYLFGVSVQAAPSFHLEAPLSGRSIRFWPWPYGDKKKSELRDLLIESDIGQRDLQHARLEAQRLLYVGVTRARDGLVLAREKSGHKLLNVLVDAEDDPVMIFEDGEINVASPTGEAQAFEAQNRQSIVEIVNGEDINARTPIAQNVSTPRYLPLRTAEITEFPAASQTPSSAGWGRINREAVTASIFASLGNRLGESGKDERADVGSALHGFIGSDCGGDRNNRLSMAEQLRKLWGVEGSLAAEDMLEASDRLQTFIAAHYPAATIMREWPIAMRTTEHQQMHGWIDLLLELPDGYVVIDHKSYPGRDAKTYARDCAPQLAVYRQAVEQATGKQVLATLIYMPIQGVIVNVGW